MITLELINLLKNDKKLKAIEGLKIVPFGTTNRKAIVYKVVPLSSDKIKEINRLEITVISEDFLEAEQILDIVKDILLTFGDSQLTNNILSVALNGGGSLEKLETGTIHLSAFFIVKNKF